MTDPYTRIMDSIKNREEEIVNYAEEVDAYLNAEDHRPIRDRLNQLTGAGQLTKPTPEELADFFQRDAHPISLVILAFAVAVADGCPMDGVLQHTRALLDMVYYQALRDLAEEKVVI